MVYSGRARLTIGEKERLVETGDFYCIPANVPHRDLCIGEEPFVMLDIFYPVREDLIARLMGATARTSRTTSHCEDTGASGGVLHPVSMV